MKAIPKFASFQPKKTPSVPIPERSSPFEINSENQSAGIESDISRRRRITKAGNECDLVHKSSKSNATVESDPSRPFTIDREGDAQILTFGTLNKYTIPSYFRFGSAKVVGLPGCHTIDKASSDEKTIILTNARHGSPIKYDRIAIWKSLPHKAPDVRIRSQPSAPIDFDNAPDFVSLRPNKRRKINNEHSLEISRSSSEDDMSHRMIREKMTSKVKPDDIDLEFVDPAVSDKSGGAECSIIRVEAQKKRGELSRKVDADPSSSTAWLEIIDNQDDLTFANVLFQSNTFTEAQTRSNAEVKLSMYQKALKTVVDPEGREALLLGKVEEAARVWDSSKSLSNMQSILREYPLSRKLWNAYLDFRQTLFAFFRFEEVRSVYLDCLALLKDSDQRMTKPSEAVEGLFEIQIHVVLRMTLFLRDGGFAEQAIAGWQALLEYNFFRLSHHLGVESMESGVAEPEILSSFEAFWDSEVPRLGEEGWKGWASFCQGQHEVPPPKSSASGALDQSEGMWPSWTKLEYEQTLSARGPARTIDDVVEDDPYRVILYSDIQHFTLEAPSSTSRSTILDAFLAFCRLPPLSAIVISTNSRSWWRDGCVQNGIPIVSHRMMGLRMLRHGVRDHTLLKGGQRPREYHDAFSSKSSPFDLPISDYLLSSDTLIAPSGSWFSAFDTWSLQHMDDKGPMKKSWVLQVLKSLVSAGVGDSHLAEYLLALELRVSPENARNTAKSLLKKQSSNLWLYNAYALIECRLGNPDKGESAIMAAIDFSKKLDEINSRDSILLWRTWAWELLCSGKAKEALTWLLMYGGEGALSKSQPKGLVEDQHIKPALILRASRALAATRDHSISIKTPRHAVLAIECLVLIDYLKSSQSLSAAATSFTSNIEISFGQNPEKTPELELLHQSLARLLYHHATHTRQVKPSDIRSLLSESMKHFPHNTIFLSLYAWNEARFRLDDRVRSVVREILLSGNKSSTQRNGRRDNVVLHFFAIHHESNRSTTFGGNASTIRATFERAVSDEDSAHCAGIWRWYFLYEYYQGDMATTKNVFWRAIKACPWVKELYMLAFEYLSGQGGFRDEELRSIYELMTEKELRIHISLEDVFDEIDERKAVQKG